VKCFFQCPLRYRWRYLEGRREAFRSIESFLGSTVHDVLEWLYRERSAGADPDDASMLEHFAQRWSDTRDDSVAVVRVDDDDSAYLRLGREMLTRFRNDTFSRDRSETIALEQRLSLRLSETVIFTGFADRVGRTDGGRLFVVDYKTSRSEGNNDEFSEGLQAPLYAACVMNRYDEREALAGYHYLRHGSTRWRRIEDDRARRIFERFLELVRTVECAEEFPARPSVLCAWCGFNGHCPSAKVPEALSGGLRRAEELGRRLL
jgi:RecB family exonuclease